MHAASVLLLTTNHSTAGTASTLIIIKNEKLLQAFKQAIACNAMEIGNFLDMNEKIKIHGNPNLEMEKFSNKVIVLSRVTYYLGS